MLSANPGIISMAKIASVRLRKRTHRSASNRTWIGCTFLAFAIASHEANASENDIGPGSSSVHSYRAMPIADEAASRGRDGLWGTPGVYYEILSRPATSHREPKPRTLAPEIVRPVTPYAYGYFGARSSPQWYRQFGHQQSYTQYSLR